MSQQTNLSSKQILSVKQASYPKEQLVYSISSFLIDIHRFHVLEDCIFDLKAWYGLGCTCRLLKQVNNLQNVEPLSLVSSMLSWLSNSGCSSWIWKCMDPPARSLPHFFLFGALAPPSPKWIFSSLISIFCWVIEVLPLKSLTCLMLSLRKWVLRWVCFSLLPMLWMKLSSRLRSFLSSANLLPCSCGVHMWLQRVQRASCLFSSPFSFSSSNSLLSWSSDGLFLLSYSFKSLITSSFL